MGIPWLSVLQAVPWSDVISKAPQVAEGARKLWKSVGQRDETPDAEPQAVSEPAAAAPRDAELTTLRARTRALEAEVGTLRDQLEQSSSLLQALAEQNTQLVARVELQRVRLQRTLALAAAGMVASVAALLGVLLR
jgi:hypothetical protein